MPRPLCALLAFGVLFSIVRPVEARTDVRWKWRLAESSVIHGGLDGALYLRDSSGVTQYDGFGVKRARWELEGDEQFFASPEGFYIAFISPAGAAGRKNGSSGVDSLPESWSHSCVILDRGARDTLYLRFPADGQLFLNDDGRFVITENKNNGVELWVFERDGSRLGLAHVRVCDTVIFAPEERGFVTRAASSETHYFRYSGVKVNTYPPSQLFVFSPDGRGQALVEKGLVTLYEETRVRKSFRLPRVAIIKAFYEPSSGRFFALNNKHLYCIRIGTEEVLLDYPTLGEDHFFTDFTYNPKTDFIAVAALLSAGSQFDRSDRRSNSWLRILTSEGVEQPLYNIFNTPARRGYPKVIMSSKYNGVLFIMSDAAHKLTWQ